MKEIAALKTLTAIVLLFLAPSVLAEISSSQAADYLITENLISPEESVKEEPAIIITGIVESLISFHSILNSPETDPILISIAGN